MASRCPGAAVVGVVKIPGYRFVLDESGVATIVQESGSHVEGVLWSVTPENIRSLDRYEGVAKHCYRKESVSVDIHGSREEALVYISNRPLSPKAQRSGYMGRVIQAAIDHGLSEDYVEILRQLGGISVAHSAKTNYRRESKGSAMVHKEDDRKEYSVHLYTKNLARIASSVFDHSGALVIPAKYTKYFNDDPTLQRKSGMKTNPVNVRIGDKLIRNAHINRVGPDGATYQLRLGNDAVKELIKLCPSEYELHKAKKTLKADVWVNLYWAPRESTFVLCVDRL